MFKIQKEQSCKITSDTSFKCHNLNQFGHIFFTFMIKRDILTTRQIRMN